MNKNNKYFLANTPEEAYSILNNRIYNNPEFILHSRIGKTIEVSNIVLEINPCKNYYFKNINANKISEDYAETFWDFMISGGTDAEEAYKEYPNVAQFIAKPKSEELPDNFNTFYGPRIKSQLPTMLKELKDNPNSRRAVFQILMERDQILLDKNETLEYPCCDSVTFFIRDGVLYSNVHMRSENAAVVFQLDLYLQGRLLQFMAEQLGIPYGKLTFSMVSAHIYEKDFAYVTNIIYNK